MRACEHVCCTLERARLPPIISKSKQYHKNRRVTVSGIAFSKKGSSMPYCANLSNLLSETAKWFQTCIWDVGKLLKLLECYNWSLLLERSAKSILRDWYEFAGSGKRYVREPEEATLEFRPLMGLVQLCTEV